MNGSDEGVSSASGRGSKTINRRLTPYEGKIDNLNVIGRAGLALVEFQLLRRGHECVRTFEGGSGSGDIWAETGLGRISIEVKTTVRDGVWNLRTKQKIADIYAFVSLSDARTHILTAAEVTGLFQTRTNYSDGSIRVRHYHMPKDALEGWAKLSVRHAANLLFMPHLSLALDQEAV